ncbi:MAG: conserved phage C-terminal domain-containing protein, partial [Cloacibacterium sp.]|nr:conserved phage C-terminal domain-containing protein [Cloacibacterium sp.]
GFTPEQMISVIQLKNLEWKNNEVMAVHLCPETIFRPKNFEKYVNQILAMKNNPQLLQKFNEQFNQNATMGTASAFSKFDALFAKK